MDGTKQGAGRPRVVSAIVRMTLSLDAALAAEIRALARREDRTLSAQTQILLRQALGWNKEASAA